MTLRPSAEATYLGQTDPTQIIKTTIILRRRPGHDPIPSYESYIGCPPRSRLSVDEFAQRYGASPDDIAAVKAFCAANGMTVHSHHAARREVTISGPVGAFNTAFSVSLQNYQKGRVFHFTDRLPTLPDHLRDVVLHVALGHEPHTLAYTIQNWTDQPPNTPQGGSSYAVTPAQVAALYDCPLDGTGQNIAIIVETILANNQDDGSQTIVNTGLPFGYSPNDLALTLQNWGSPYPNIVDIAVDGASNNTNTTPCGEWTFDIAMASAFAPGADIAVYFQGSVDLLDVYNRVVHPEPGDPICHTVSMSAVYRDEATWFVTIPTTEAAFEKMLEDAAIQGVTVLMPSGDWGSGGYVGDGKAHCPGATFAGALCVGGTTIGNIQGSTFDEWLWSQSSRGSESTYRVGAGGGASAYVPIPSYQSTFKFSVSLNNGFAGRGVPDISAVAAQAYTCYLHGSQQGFGGTSQSVPSVNGMIASINKVLGYPVGFLNPTLYAGAYSAGICRDINPGNTVGGPQTNQNGADLANDPIDQNVPGYPLTDQYDCCVGLGVMSGNKLIAYLNTIYPYQNGIKEFTQPADSLLYWNHSVYLLTTAGTWYVWAGSFIPSSDPRQTPPTPTPTPTPPTPTPIPSPPTPSVDTYDISIGESAGNYTSTIRGWNAATYTFSSLQPATTYYFQVVANTPRGTSAPTTGSFATQPPISTINPPTNLTIDGITSNSATVHWIQASPTDLSLIAIKPAMALDYTTTVNNISTSNYTWTNLTANTVYVVVVQEYSSTGVSPGVYGQFQTDVGGTPTPTPPGGVLPPANLSLSATATSILATWTDPNA
jgi:kumamolisin